MKFVTLREAGWVAVMVVTVNGLLAPEVTECGHSENDVCKKCCDHQDTDDHCCIDCGKDMTEERAVEAYDREKDKDYA